MRAWIEYSAAALLLLVTALVSTPAAAEPSRDAAPGVAAYEAGEYERAYDLLKPVADAGDVQARYLMARLHSGGLPKVTDYEVALTYLDAETRCRSPKALALFAYVAWKTQPDENELVSAAFAYKEAARAGVIEAHTSLGLLLVREFSQPYEGAAYLLEAARLGEPNAIEFIKFIENSEQGIATLDQVRAVVEKQPFDRRWPLLDNETTPCRF